MSPVHTPLRWIAAVHTLGTLALMGILQRQLAMGNSFATQLLTIHAVVSAAYWAVWIWSFQAPLPASIVGLLLLISMSMADFAASGTAGTQHPRNPLGGPLPIFTMCLLIRAIVNGWRQRVLELDAQLDPTEIKPRTRGIASPILLYLILLTIVVIPRSLAVQHDLTIKDLLDVHKLMAIIVTTWVILSWRDTLPVIRTIGSLNWLITAMIFGLGTFVVASIYGDLLSYFTSVPPVKMSKPFLDEHYSWLAILGIIAAFPAIFEELAFRGIIVPALGRVLSEKETIAVSAIMFMTLHLSVPSAPHLLLMGAAVGFVRLRSKSIWPCVLMHFTHNAMCVGFERWM
jgi:membrane protease YdiL (CAAX protease family)